MKKFLAGAIAGLALAIPATALAASKPPQHIVVKLITSKQSFTDTLFVTVGSTRYECKKPDTSEGDTSTNFSQTWSKAKCPVG